MFVKADTGINDDLNGVERPVEFDIKENNSKAQVVHSLAKWKRLALHRYGFKAGEGLYTDMNAIRRDEDMDNLHSIYVDQWDWEKVIDRDSRNTDTLKSTVNKIVGVICDTAGEIKKLYPALTVNLSREVSFISTQELEDMYPLLSPKEREDKYLEDHKTAFIMQIGDILKSGIKHDGRAPDYDDWKLNGDILFWNDLLKCAFEVSSMGIRVDKESLDEQLRKSGCDDRRNLLFHVLNNEFPYHRRWNRPVKIMHASTERHIGEVQVSVGTLYQLQSVGIELLRGRKNGNSRISETFGIMVFNDA